MFGIEIIIETPAFRICIKKFACHGTFKTQSIREVRFGTLKPMQLVRLNFLHQIYASRDTYLAESCCIRCNLSEVSIDSKQALVQTYCNIYNLVTLLFYFDAYNVNALKYHLICTYSF